MVLILNTWSSHTFSSQHWYYTTIKCSCEHIHMHDFLTSVFNIFSFARTLASSHKRNNPFEFVNLLVSCKRNLFDMITGELVIAATDDRLLVVLVIFWIGKDCTVAIQIMIIIAMCWKPERNIVTVVMKIEDFKICSTLHETWCLISTASI